MKCDDKQSYISERQALDALREMRKRRRGRDVRHLVVYACQAHGWHLGHDAKTARVEVPSSAKLRRKLKAYDDEIRASCRHYFEDERKRTFEAEAQAAKATRIAEDQRVTLEYIKRIIDRALGPAKV